MNRSVVVWTVSVLVYTLFGCRPTSEDTSTSDLPSVVPPSAQTQVIIDKIDSLLQTDLLLSSPSRNVELAAVALSDYEQSDNNSSWRRYITEQFRSGEYAGTAMTQQRSFEDGKITADKLSNATLMVYELLALAYLRVGIDLHGGPIILPVTSDQVHADAQYVQATLQILDIMIPQFPERTDYLWYYNICHMLSGTYPSAVPNQYLISLDHLRKATDKPIYKNIAAALGVREYRNGGCSVWLDIDGDTDLDLLSTSRDLDEQILVYRNEDGRLINATNASGIKGLTGGSTMCAADIDNDGDLDIFIGRGQSENRSGQAPVSLLRNNGDGTFDDISIAAGMTKLLSVGGADWGDYNTDGYVDLYVGTESIRGMMPPLLYRNNGNNTFTNVIDQVIPDAGLYQATAVTWTDVNEDLRPDLIVSYQQFKPDLFINSGDTLLQRTKSAIRNHLNTNDILPLDVDNDGDQDLLLVAHAKTTAMATQGYLSESTIVNHLYINDGAGNFTPNHEALGTLAYVQAIHAASATDVDLDGDLDIYLSTGGREMGEYIPNRLYYNDGGNFVDGSASSHAALLSQCRGIAVASIDADPAPELLVNGGGYYAGDHAPTVVFDSQDDTEHSYIIVKLEGKLNNRIGLGSTVNIYGKTSNGLGSRISREVDTGRGMVTMHHHLPIGLGAMATIDSIVVRWPDGLVQRLVEPKINTTIAITESL